MRCYIIYLLLNIHLLLNINIYLLLNIFVTKYSPYNSFNLTLSGVSLNSSEVCALHYGHGRSLADGERHAVQLVGKQEKQ